MKKTKRKSVHHRQCVSNGGNNEPENLIEVNHGRHMGWHQCFDNKTPEKIVWELNNIWLPVDVKVILVRKPPPNDNQLTFWS